MSISNLWMLGPVVTAAGQINQIREYSPESGVEVLKHMSDGLPDPNFAAVMMQAPRLNLTTTAIARAMAIATPSLGYAITGNADFWFQKIAQGGVRSGSATSMRVRGTKGMLVPQQLSCDDKGVAQLTLAMVLISADGVTSPIAMATAQSMPSVTLADQLFTLGPIRINGAYVEGVKRTTIDFGLELIVEHGSGEPYPTFCGVKSRQSRITFQTTDPSLLGDTGYFAAQGTTDSEVFFWKVAKNGTRVARTTAEHLLFGVDDGIIHTTTIGGGSSDDPQMTEVVIEPTYDGTNDLLAFSGAAAIDAE